MALFRKQERPKGFTRKPLYWDPEKEERENREKRIKAELGLVNEKESSASHYRADLKGKFRSAAHGDRQGLHQQRKKNLRKMMLFIVVLVALLYFILTALPLLEQFLEKFMN